MALISLTHCGTNLFEHPPCTLVVDSKIGSKLSSRNATFVLGHKIQRIEPRFELQMAAVHEGSSSDRSLTMALITLIQAIGKNAMPLAAAFRADKTFRPTHFDQIIPTVIFSGKSLGELGDGNALGLAL